MFKTFTVMTAILTISIIAIAENSAKDEINSETAYERQINALRNSDSVIPPAFDVHPVAAMYNREGVIPPQCYTKTEGKHNPCYVCHQDPIDGRENVMSDGLLQVAYSFSDKGMTNHWKNLFEDRTAKVEAISNEDIITWVNQDNYSALAASLQSADYKGWIPDLENLQLGKDAFDEYGFAKDGSHWVSFNYKPLPSTFWPTNGSTDDVMIRLPEVYRNDENGQYSLDIYRANLAIVEANIKGLDEISSLPVDEKIINKDLNFDGQLSTISNIKDVNSYVGAASDYFIDTHLYPEGTEFLHSVRYLGIDGEHVGISTRMKELRYMKKWRAYEKGIYDRNYQLESFEKEAGHLPGYASAGDYGLDNGSGWSIIGFIEGANGELRKNTFEENFFCMGCHNSVGSTIDKTFSFARKLDGADGWGYIDLKGMPDAPNMGEEKGEILTYFERAGGGDEFRSNTEMRERWFKPNGEVDTEKVRAARDVYSLITPSVARALRLNKAYKAIVSEQDFIYGRDATISAPINVYSEVNNETAPTLPAERMFKWDIRLDWQSATEK